VSGYEQLLSDFKKSSDEGAPVFRPFTRNADAVKGMALDANAVAQEKGTEAVCAFVEFGGKAAGR
jgi:cytoskeleton-associated protein 5